jgi:undecaprenyl-diphosphatase
VDFSLLDVFNDAAQRNDAFEDVARFFAVDGQFLIIALLALLFFSRGRWASAEGRRAVAAAGFSALAALGVAQVISHLWERPRPSVAHPDGVQLFIPASHDPSFPSDHATAAFAIAAVLLLVLGVRALPVLLAAVALAASRVLVGIHYPGDVLAGALLGSAAAVAVVLAARRWPPAGLRATSSWS